MVGVRTGWSAHLQSQYLGREGRGCPQLHRKLEAILGYIKPCLKKQQQKSNKNKEEEEGEGGRRRERGRGERRG